MSPTLFARSKLEDIKILDCGKDYQAIVLEEEEEYHWLDQILSVLAASDFEEIFLQDEIPFLRIARTVDRLRGHRPMKPAEMRRTFDAVATVLFSKYHPKGTLGTVRNAIFDVIRTKTAIDSSNNCCPIITYWKDKGKELGCKFDLDQELDLKPIDLTPLNCGEQDLSDEFFRVVTISSTIAEIHVRPNVSCLPDYVNDATNVSLEMQDDLSEEENTEPMEVDGRTLTGKEPEPEAKQEENKIDKENSSWFSYIWSKILKWLIIIAKIWWCMRL